MTRKGTLEFLGILLMIAFFINFFTMVAEPSLVYNSLEFATDDLDPRIESGGLATFLEDGYITDALNYSFLQQSYDSALEGGGSQPYIEYHVNNVPSQAEIRQALLDDTETSLSDNYLVGHEGKEGCGLPAGAENFPGIELGIVNHSLYNGANQGILFNSTVDGDKLTVQCESDNTVSKFDISVQNEIFSHKNRYFKAYNRTRDILRNETLNKMIDDMHRNASRTMVVESCTITDDGQCGSTDPSQPISSDVEDNIEDAHVTRKWEGEAGSILAAHLDEQEDHYNDLFNETNFTVELSVDGVDYRPYDVSTETDLKFQGDVQDYYDSGDTGCDDCNWECPIEDNTPDDSEDYESYCVNELYSGWDDHESSEGFDDEWSISMSTTQGTVEDDADPLGVSEGEPWTHSSDTGETDTSCDYSVPNPYPEYDINWGGVDTPTSVDFVPGTNESMTDIGLMLPDIEQNKERKTGQYSSCQARGTSCYTIAPIQDDGDDECECSESSCDRDTGSKLQRRTMYNYSMQTAVQIQVEVKDNRSRLFVDGEDSGEEHLRFVTHYTYRSWDDHHQTVANWGSSAFIDYEPRVEQFRD